MASRIWPLAVRLAVIGIGLICMSANQHLQTSADPQTREFRIRIDGEVVECNLEAPGTEIVTYPNGNIQSLRFDVVTTRIFVTFHPERRHGEEMVNSLQRYNMYDDKIIPDGEWQSLSPNGALLTRHNWQAGKLHGRQETYNRFGQLIKESHYDEGYPVGVWKMYYAEGGIATAVTFPESASLWRDTLPTGGIYTDDEAYRKRLSLMQVRTHASAKEVWYSQNGVKLKELQYRVHAEPTGTFTMIPSGCQKTFRRNGTLQTETRLQNGTGKTVEHLRDAKGAYQRVTHWTGGHVNSSHLSRPSSP